MAATTNGIECESMSMIGGIGVNNTMLIPKREGGMGYQVGVEACVW